jgi:DNA repair photolyase
MLRRLEADLKLLSSGSPLLAKCGKEWIEVSAEQRSGSVFMMFSGDLYSPPWQHSDLPRKILELFNRYKVPFDILTKGGMKAVQDFDLYIAGCRFWTTLIFDHDADTQKWEPNAALPEDRIAAMQIAHERGIKTCVSFEPVIDPEQTLRLMKQTAPFMDDCFIGKLNTAGKNLPAELVEIERRTDWPKFRAEAEAVLNNYHKDYMIKEALRRATEEPRAAAGREQEAKA